MFEAEMSPSRKWGGILIFFLLGILAAYFARDFGSGFLIEKKIPELGILGLTISLFFLRKNSQLFLMALFGLSFLLGIGRFTNSFPEITPNFLAFYNGWNQELILEGVVADEVVVKEDRLKLTVEVYKLERRNEKTNERENEMLRESRNVKGKVLVTVSRYPEYRYGDKLLIKGKLESPGEFSDFSYQNYLARSEIYSVMDYPEIKFLEKGQGNFILGGIFKLKKILEKNLNQIFPEPEASLAAGLLLGSRQGISKNLMTQFNLTGLTHIIAVSGFNVTIVIVFVTGLLRFCSRKIKIILAVLAIVFFALLVGCSASVVRASVMGILGLLAVWFGRPKKAGLALVLAAFLMNLFNPKILVYDAGFQLSFAATLGLIYVSPFLEKYFQKIPAFLSLREAFLMTISAQIATIPLILLHFGRISLAAPFSNALVIPVIPLAMFFSFLAVVFKFVFFEGALLIGYLGWFFLKYIVLIAHFFSQIPFSSFEI